MLFATPPIESGKTLQYKLIKTDGTVTQNWTSSGVTERQIDATANESIYQVDVVLATSYEGHIFWKTNDSPPVTYSEVINHWMDSSRAANLDILARRVEIPAAPTFTAASGILNTGIKYYRITSLHPWGESMPSAEASISTFQLATPVNEAFTTGAGTLAPGTYYYRVSALNAVGETLASAETSHTIAGVGGVNVNWGAVSGATGYKIYGRATGAELLIATVSAVVTWLDDGSITPSGALPAENNTNGLNINWVAVANAIGYKIYGRETGLEQLLATVGLVTTWADDGSVTPSGALPTETSAGLESMLDTVLSLLNSFSATISSFTFSGNSVIATQSYPSGEVIYNSSNSKISFATTLVQAVSDYWNDVWLTFKSGANANQTKKVVGYDGTTNFITVASQFTNIPGDGDAFELVNK